MSSKYTYVIGDVHGMHSYLIRALDAINEHQKKNKGEKKIIFLGDYCDRGPRSMDVFDTAMGLPDAICLKGNHEDMFVGAYDDYVNKEKDPWPALNSWYLNGGEKTIASFGVKSIDQVDYKYIKWMKSLPLFYEDDHRFYVHAGIDPTVPLKEQKEIIMLWQREPFLSYPDKFEKHIVHGHTPTAIGPECLSNRTNLDTGCFYSKILTVGIFLDDIPGGPVDIIQIKENIEDLLNGF